MGLSVAMLYFIPYTTIATEYLALAALLLSIPIAAYRLEYRLFARRAIIERAGTPNGLVRRWFWNPAGCT